MQTTILINNIEFNIDAIEITESFAKNIKTIILRTNIEIEGLEELQDTEINIQFKNNSFNIYANQLFFNGVDSYYIVQEDIIHDNT